MQLENHISSLLKQHNCVIVPEFGGFIANYESAWINHSRGIIYPPHKQVLFNPNLVQNDGLLANELVQVMMISYADALAKISVEVKYWRKHLEAGERIELNEIGFLFLQNGQVVFEQNREVNLLLQAYGLKQVNFVPFGEMISQPTTSVVATKSIAVSKPNKESVKPTKSTKPTIEIVGKPGTKKIETPVIALNTNESIEQIETVQDDPQIIPITHKKNRNYKYAVAAAVILPVMFYAYWIPMKTDFLNTGKVQMGDFNPFNKQANSVYQKRDAAFEVDNASDWKSWEELTGALPANVAVYNLELNEELYIPVQLEGVTPDAGAFNADGAFHVIAGCFSVQSNAENFVAQLTEKGYTAGIVDQHKGLFRVSAGAFNAETEAETAVDAVEKDGYSGWVLKK